MAREAYGSGHVGREDDRSREHGRVIEFGVLALLGVALGAFGTLVGAGGGFLLVPILLVTYPDTPPETITAMSLFVVLANAASGTVAYWRQRRIDLLTGGLFALATLPGAIGGAILVSYIPRQMFSILFATVLSAIGGWLLLSRDVTAIRAPLVGRGVMRRRITDHTGYTYVYGYRLWHGLSTSAVVGFASSLLGIGGGISTCRSWWWCCASRCTWRPQRVTSCWR